MQKIPNFHHFWKFWSVRLAFVSGLISTVALAVIAAYALLPADWLPVIPDGFKQVVSYLVLGSAAVTALLAGVSRGVHQPKLTPKE